MHDSQAGPADPHPHPVRFYGNRESVVAVTLHEPISDQATVPERFVQDLWHRQLFSHTDLRTVCGRRLDIVRPGTPNSDAGPDFSDAWIRLDDVEWHGHVEIHVASGHWKTHRHHTDAQYDGTVLHVVLYTDLWTGRLERSDGSLLPELVLFPYLTAPLRTLIYDFHTRTQGALLCSPYWDDVPSALRRSWIRSLALRRLDERRRAILDERAAGADPDDVLQRRLYKCLGYAKNADGMETLALRLPAGLLRRYPTRFDLAALHLGVAGFLDDPSSMQRASIPEGTVSPLKDRFETLKSRHRLVPMLRNAWKYFRLRPGGFPHRRILQAASYFVSGGLLHRAPLDRLLTASHSLDPLAALRTLARIRPIETLPDEGAPIEEGSAGAGLSPATVDRILINTFIPMLAAVARERDDRPQEAILLEVLLRLPPENDAVTRRFADLGEAPLHALMSQGQHELYRTHCKAFRCLHCAIGQHILQHPA